MSTNVSVVGAGLAGLVAANHLADAGAVVTVWDGAGHAGGRAHTTRTFGAARNLGPHAVYRRGDLARALRGFRIPLAGRSPGVVRPRILLDGRDRLSGAVFGRTAHRLLRLRHRPAAGRSLAGWLDDVGLDGDARRLAEALARTTTYTQAPDLVDAAAVRDQLLLATGNVVYVHGGWQTIVDALAARLVAHGGAVRTSAGVREVTVSAAGIEVHGSGGHRHHADGVVLAVGGPSDAGRLLAGPIGDGLRSRRDVPVRMATLDLVVEATGMTGPTAVLGDGADPRYLAVPSRVAELAPSGREVVHVARYLAPGERGDAATRRDLEDLLDRYRPGWRDHLVDARFLPNLVVSHALPLASAGGLSGRAPVVPAHDLPLGLAGDAIGPRGLLADAAAASARAAARHVVARVASGRAPSIA